MTPHELGQLGEQLATNHLIKEGYQILDRQWRFGKIELDIIAQQDDWIVFVEVKTRENNYVGEPWESVTRSKQKRIVKAAHEYLLTRNLDLESRFDVISIIHKSKYQRLEHIPHAFYPSL